MDSFDLAFERTIESEGGFSDVKGDRGGRTKFGIIEKTFKFALERGIISGVKDIADLTKAQAKAIYKTLFWHTLSLYQVADDLVAAEIFDTAVNMGPHTAIIITQSALKYLGEDVDIDGIIGTQTLGAINRWCKKDAQTLFKVLNGFQFVGYCDLVEPSLIDKIQELFKDSKDQRQFAWGWMKRIQEYKR